MTRFYYFFNFVRNGKQHHGESTCTLYDGDVVLLTYFHARLLTSGKYYCGAAEGADSYGRRGADVGLAAGKHFRDYCYLFAVF